MHSKDLSQFQGAVAIIAAAGTGSRMQSQTPKQYLKINRQTILDITLDKFIQFDPVKLIVLVISPEDVYYKHLENADNKKVVIIEGGASRAESVHNALRFLFDSGLADETPVMVHDAARPCITEADLGVLYSDYQTDKSPCLLVAPVVDTLQQIGEENTVKGVVDRENLVRAFTPQMASFLQLKSSVKLALDSNIPVTDEVSALTNAGYSVKPVNGRSDNIKVTHNADLALAEFYLQKQNESK